MTKKIITQQSVLSQGKIETSQKTNNSLNNLRINETNIDGTLETTHK